MNAALNMNFLYEEHDVLLARLDAMRKVVTILNFPESLMHEVRRDWPELRGLLRGLHHYLAVDLPLHFENEEKSLFSRLLPSVMPDEQAVLQDLISEHRGLQFLIGSVIELTSPWLDSERPPARADVARLNALASELNVHLERHVRIENERVLPLAAAILSQDDRETMSKECETRLNESHLKMRKAAA